MRGRVNAIRTFKGLVADLRLNTKIETAISQLPPKSREAFTLSYLHDMKSKDIALEMNISVRTVDAHIYTALRQLRNKLQLADLYSD